MRERGQEVKLVIAATPNTHMRCDPLLLKALGRAQLWKDDLLAEPAFTAGLVVSHLRKPLQTPLPGRAAQNRPHSWGPWGLL